ncbi:MAG: hypothetical protein FJ395_00345 [Verrucomicrobia bacterium]|nr:hypothetical protein [Verrucomicrobiota bacterium]
MKVVSEGEKRLKPSASTAAAAPAMPPARNAYRDEKPFEQLSDKQITDWGKTARPSTSSSIAARTAT